jgi:plastocyanin
MKLPTPSRLRRANCARLAQAESGAITVSNIDKVVNSFQSVGFSLVAGAALLGSAPPVEAATTNIVEVRSYLFVPSVLQINAGDTIRWTNTSTIIHDVTQGTRANGATPNPYWAATSLAAFNGRFSVTFSNVGSYPYICERHVIEFPMPASNPTQTGLVSVVIGNLAPTVAIIAPTNISRFAAPASFILSANASDSDGTVTNVEFFAGTTLLGSASTAPYTIAAGPLASGVYPVTARARDNLGATTTSVAVNVVVNTNHTVSVSGFTFVPNVLTVTVGDSVTFQGLEGLHTVTGDTVAEPFCGIASGASCQVTFNRVGIFAYHCTPHQNLGMTGIVTVAGPNFQPMVTLTAPADGSVFAAPATFDLAADASDFGGSVASVRFIRGGTTSLGNPDSTAPYTGIASTLAAGNYVLTARVTDDKGLLNTSAPVNITVVTPVNIQLLSPASGAGGFQFNYTANRGLRYIVEGSANSGSPSPFVPLTTNVATSNLMTFIDPADVGRSNRAYRVFRQQ